MDENTPMAMQLGAKGRAAGMVVFEVLGLEVKMPAFLTRVAGSESQLCSGFQLPAKAHPGMHWCWLKQFLSPTWDTCTDTWLLASTLPSPGHCTHLVNEPEDGSSSVFLFVCLPLHVSASLINKLENVCFLVSILQIWIKVTGKKYECYLYLTYIF